MASIKATTFLRLSPRLSSTNFLNGFHTTNSTYLDQRWRKKQGLTRNPNGFGPLTNQPDYSFKDGRVVPYGTGQLRRIDKQREYAEKIVKLVGEIDYAVEKYNKKQLEEKERRQKILDSKLKPKGQLLLEKKTSS